MEQIRITPLNAGHLRFDLSGIYHLPPEHLRAGQFADVPILSYHIALPGRSVLVDATDYDAAQIGDGLRLPNYSPPPSLAEQLRAQGIAPAEISHVIITHLHFDHYGALSTVQDGRYTLSFPQARHFVNSADWQPEDFDEFDENTLGLVARQGLLELVSGEVDLGDGLAILPLPGETAGHQAVCLTTAEGEYYFAGDLYHHTVELMDTAQDVHWADIPQMRRSKVLLINRALEKNGQAYFTHIDGPYRAVKKENGTIVWESVQNG